MKNSRFLLVLAGALVMLGAFSVRTSHAALDEAAVNKCSTCHEGVVKDFMKGTHHGKALQAKEGKFSCESCHGDATKHIAEGDKTAIISFGKKAKASAEEQSKQCLSCHQKNKELMFWDNGFHKKEDVSCSSCHNTHSKEKMKPLGESCLNCHKDIKAKLSRNSHHPILEGKVSCNDCHNSHGTLGHGMIRAENANNLCYKCHADKRGPFMWEHPPVEENCMACHDAHGSKTTSLLTERQPYLCQQCHTNGRHPTTAYTSGVKYDPVGAAGTFNTNSRFTGRSCVNCHVKIHGSNAAHLNGNYSGGKYFLR